MLNFKEIKPYHQKVTLIGMMGTGKSKLGRQIANILKFNFYDIVSLGKGRSQLYMATLPRLKSRVRIPSPAPKSTVVRIVSISSYLNNIQNIESVHHILSSNCLCKFY